MTGGNDFEELVYSLTREHWRIKESLKKLEEALDEEDPRRVATVTTELSDLLTQHITNEEAHVLKLLLTAYGSDGADWAIQVFQQHRPISRLIEEIKALAPYSYEMGESKATHLERLLDEHCLLEEKDIFPWAVATFRRSFAPHNG